MPKAPPSFNFWHSDFMSGTYHLSPEAVGAYVRLLCWQWANGWISKNPDTVRKITGIETPEKFDRVWREISCKFEIVDNPEPVEGVEPKVLANVRMLIERPEAIRAWENTPQVRAKRQAAGRLGAIKRWQKDGKCHSNANGKTMANDGKAGRRKKEEEEGIAFSDSVSSQNEINLSTARTDDSPPPPTGEDDPAKAKSRKKSAAKTPAIPSKFILQLRGGTPATASQDVIDRAKSVYGWSDADIERVVGKATLWCMTHRKQAPAEDIDRFLVNWFAKEDEIQRRNRSYANTTANTPAAKPPVHELVQERLAAAFAARDREREMERQQREKGGAA